MRPTGRSNAAFERAKRVLVGGVNSPVRAFAAVGGVPPFIASAAGSKLRDVDDNEYIDYVCGYGPMILGHAHLAVVEALRAAAGKGACYGAPTEAESELAELVVEAFPSIEKVRFVSSGTEATMSAVRLARGSTGRDKIIKCRGGYHGHSDALLVTAGSGATTLGVPSSPGIPKGATADTVLVNYNNLPELRKAFRDFDSDLAAVLIEPVAGNMGVVPPQAGYLRALRELCSDNGTLLIFDEVMTGFRVAHGGAQGLYGVRPDLTTLGKIMGGGMPVGALGGSAAIMDYLSPVGPVYQAGTLSGNPLAMSAGIATLRLLRDEGLYADLERTSATLAEGLMQAAAGAGLQGRVCLNRVGSMMTPFFASGPVVDYQTALTCDTRAFAAFFGAMLAQGINMAPSQFEAMFVSLAHTASDVARTVEAAGEAFSAAAALMDSLAAGR